MAKQSNKSHRKPYIGAKYLYKSSNLIVQVVGSNSRGYYSVKILEKGTSGFKQGDIEEGVDTHWFRDMERLPNFQDYLKQCEI